MILNEEQIERIILLLKSRNKMNQQHILDEMTDHFCCLVEKKMILGNSFEEAFNQVSEELNPVETQEIEKFAKRIQFKMKLRKKIKSVTAVAATLILLIVAGADAQIKPEGSPLKGEHKITSKFGIKRGDPSKKQRYHFGVDYKTGMGTPIYATADGIVGETQFAKDGYGIKIIIDHKENYQTLFAHLSKIEVKEGQEVSKGDVIGYSGNSGQSTHHHLHYEVLKGGKRVNPHPYIDAEAK